MVDEVKFDQLKRSGPANTKGDDLFLRRTRRRAPLNAVSPRRHSDVRTDKGKSAMKAHQISKRGLPAEVIAAEVMAASRWAVGGNEMRSRQLMENGNARDPSKDFLWIWRSAANGIA
jgi:hypothetical protein